MTKASTPPANSSSPGRPSPRKLRTSRRIQEEALRLFLDQGYDATTVEQVAKAAGVSHMTVFRHFPTKEDLVLQDEYDPIIAEAIRSRPVTEPILKSLRYAIVESLAEIPEHEIELARQRTHLILTTPALMAKLWVNTIQTNQMLAQALKARGGAPDDTELEIITAIASGIFATTMLRWIQGGTRDSIAALLNHAFSVGHEAFASAAAEPCSET